MLLTSDWSEQACDSILAMRHKQKFAGQAQKTKFHVSHRDTRETAFFLPLAH